MPDFGKLKRIDPRESWKNEAHDFTPWLKEHIELLGEPLGMELEVIGTEVPVGLFSADLLAKDLNSGRLVLIENELEGTDHSHLGQLITYASGLDANILVWICTKVLDEHRQAITWLNEHSDEDVGLCAIELELLQIDDSRYAPNFKLVVIPNEWQKRTRGETDLTSEPTERGLKYQIFFTKLLDKLRSKKVDFRLPARVGTYSALWFSSGQAGLSYVISFTMNKKLRIELYIDVGEKEKNKEVYDAFFKLRDEIQANIGTEVFWERLDDRRASRIAVYENGSISDDQTRLDELTDWVTDTFIKFRMAMSKHFPAK